MSGRTLPALTILLVAGTPLCLLPGVFLSHDVMPRAVATLAGAACLLFLLPEWAGGVAALWNRPTGRVFLSLVAAQGVSLSVSTVFSTQPALSFAGAVWRRFGMAEQASGLVIAVAVAALAVTRERWATSLLRSICVCGGAASIYGILQYFGIDPFLDPKLYRIEFLGGIVRPPGTMGHAIYFAAYLTPVALLASSMAFDEISPR